jgi:alcohol dehydrogenase class IV
MLRGYARIALEGKNMKINYCMPTRILMGENCIFENRGFLGGLGAKALLVTGKHSARENGALADAVKALEANGQSSFLYDRVMSNPTVDCVFEAADAAKQAGCDFVLAIGGGSPMDAAKAAAALAVNPVQKSELFGAAFPKALPVAAVPTTAGTGSEVTQYAIVTNDAARTKTSVASPALFPRVAFLDAKYTRGLNRTVTVNTAVDALSHAVEGMLSVRASVLSDALARESITAIAECFDALCDFRDGSPMDTAIRRKLLYASALAGMVIANTGTTAIHSTGYMLTYNKNIDHGRANGLLFAEFLKFIEGKERGRDYPRIPGILSALRMGSLDEFAAVLDKLLLHREKLEAAELEQYAETAITAKNVLNTVIPPEKEDLLAILRKSVG